MLLGTSYMTSIIQEDLKIVFDDMVLDRVPNTKFFGDLMDENLTCKC